MSLLLEWFFKTLIILLTAYLLPGFRVESIFGAFVLVVVLGVLNVLVKPVLFILTLPATILSLGLFIFILNALVLSLAVWFVPGVSSISFMTTLLASIIISVGSWFVSGLTKNSKE